MSDDYYDDGGSSNWQDDWFSDVGDGGIVLDIFEVGETSSETVGDDYNYYDYMSDDYYQDDAIEIGAVGADDSMYDDWLAEQSSTNPDTEGNSDFEWFPDWEDWFNDDELGINGGGTQNPADPSNPAKDPTKPPTDPNKPKNTGTQPGKPSGASGGGPSGGSSSQQQKQPDLTSLLKSITDLFKKPTTTTGTGNTTTSPTGAQSGSQSQINTAALLLVVVGVGGFFLYKHFKK